jgi:hypothetical protein
MVPAIHALMQTVVATGHPSIPTGDFDFTPLVYVAIILVALRRARVPFRIWVIPIVFVAGALIDSISDGLHLSAITTVPVLALLALLMHSRRRWTPPLPPSEV